MKKNWTRLLALLLSLAMVTALLPAAAAEGTAQEVPDNPGIEAEMPDTPEEGKGELDPPAEPPEDGEEETDSPAEPPEEEEEELDPPAEPPEEEEEETAPPADPPEEEEEETDPPAEPPEDGEEKTDPPANPPEDAVLDSAGAALNTALEIPLQLFAASSGEYEYVLDTDGIDSGAVYAIYTNETSDGDNRILYHTGTGQTDKLGGSVADGKLTLNGSFAVSRQLWTVEETDGGYTIQSVDSRYYLDLTNASAAKINTSADPVVLEVALAEDGTYTVAQSGGSCVSYDAASNGNYYAGTEAAPLRFFKRTSAAEPEPPVIPGYTRVTSADLDPEKYHLIVTQDSDGNIYALYANEAGAGVNSGALTGASGRCTARLTVEGETVTAAYLTDGSELALEDLRFTAEASDGRYSFASNNYYLQLTGADNTMFSADQSTFDVSVSEEGAYTIKTGTSNSSDRKLDFNRNGDSASVYPSNITDFWGPRPSGSTSFPIYLYTQDGVTVEPEAPAIPDRAEEGKREYVQVSGALESGYYAIRANGNTMYCKTGKTTTDQCGASVSVSGGKLTMDAHPDCHVWLILKGRDGYTIQSMGGGGQYLSYGTAGQYSHLPVSEDAAVFQITPEGDTYTISWTGESGETLYVSRGNNINDKEKWGTGTEPYSIELYQEIAPEEPEVPEKPGAPDDLSVYIYPKASGELEDGGVYAIVGSTVENSTARPRVMHCEASYSVTNQCQVGTNEHVNGIPIDQIAMSCGAAHLWKVKAVDGGYTFQSLTGPYLGQRSGYDQLPVGSTPAVFDVAPLENGGYAITWTAGGTALNLGWNGKWGGGTEPYTIYLYKMTEVEPEMAQTHFSGVSYGQPLVKGDTGSSYFRIPALLTLDNGWILAASDIRWQTSADNPQNLDTIVSISKDGGATWEWEVVNYYADEAITTTSQASAAFIDPSFVQSGDGTVWMAVDATPSYVGLMGGNRRGYASRGFDSQGRMLVALGQADADAPIDTAPYTYYVDLNAEGAVYEVDGETVALHSICASGDDSETGYWVDAFLDLYYDYGEEGGMKPVLCAQRGSDKVVQNNLFYRQSQWKAYPAFFIMVRSAQVTDSGLEWGEPKYLDIKLSENESFLGVCPGRGVTAAVDGHERIIFPLYDNQTGTELASVVYSDDGGQTWTRGSRANNLNGTGKSSESQIVRLPDGNLRMYSRNTVDYLGYADSTDGGATWGPYTRDEDLYSENPGNGCMVSFINLDGVLVAPDNTVYENLILASYPRLQRTTGTVRIGSIAPETHVVTWLNSDTQYVPAGGGSSFAYSCLTQLQGADGRPGDTFGLLYEYSPETSTIHYVSITLDELLGEDWSLLPELPVLPEISLDRDLLDLDVGGSGTLTAAISLPGIEPVWTSSDETVAAVDGGTVTGLAAGRAVITAAVTVGPLTRSASAEVVVQSDVITVPTKYTDAVSSQFFPVVTTYELETGDLESGAVYAVFDAANSRRILYHAAGAADTNQWMGSASDGLLNLSGAKTTAVLWTATQTEDGGYTLCSLDDGKYLNYGASGVHNQVPVTDAPHAFAITPLGDGSFAISWETGAGAVYLDWNGKWGAGTSEYPLQLFRRVETEAYTIYTAHAENLLALIEAAGADEADYADVLALAGPYNTEAEAQTAQARIDAAALALYTAFRAPAPEPVPVYTVTYQITGSYFANASYAVQRYEEGAAVTPVPAPGYYGYTFSGWTGVPALMPGRDVIVTGSFALSPVSGGDDDDDDDYDYEPPAPEVEIREEETPLASLPFTDIPEKEWYVDAVVYVQEKGLMQGTSEHTFAPAENLSRGMMVQVLFNLAGKPETAGEAAFADVVSGAWYAQAVAWAAGQEIVSGYGSAFGPDDHITREQMAVMLYNYAKTQGIDITVNAEALQTFQDSAQISDWAREAMAWAVDSGVITGKDGGLLAPAAAATRAEAAAILMRFCEQNAGQDGENAESGAEQA